MRFLTLMTCVLAFAAAQQLQAQEPRPAGNSSYLGATIGNSVLQLRYLSPSPVNPSNSRTDLDIVPGLTFAIGPQAYVALLNPPQKTDVAAISAGASVRYDFLQRLGLAAFGSAFYSPGVLTFGNAHNLYDFMAGGEVRFTPRLVGQACYRWLKFTLVGQPDYRVGNEIFAGLRWRMD